VSIDKEDVINVLEKISARDGIITTRSVLDEARKESSPIHKYFEWDDSVAAESWRRQQARKLIKSVRVEFMGKEMDGYWNAKVQVSEDEESQGYFSLHRVLEEDALYEEVLGDAVKSLRHWQKKYSGLKELKDVINEEKLELLEIESKVTEKAK